MEATTTIDLGQRLARVRARIAAACERSGRDPASVVIIGVTKGHPPEVAAAARDHGLIDLGENLVGELLDKAAAVPGVRWHLVGRLQRRKARHVVGRVALIHSVDRRTLIDELARRAAAAGVLQRILIQVNVADDPAKGGCRIDEVQELVAYARAQETLLVEGLMTVPPLPPPGADPVAAARPHYATLRRLRDELRERWSEVVHLSMGMSDDLEAAVEEGATMVRVGTALFGPRPTTRRAGEVRA